MTEEHLKAAKQKMHEYRDPLGNELSLKDAIDSATTKEELEELFWKHCDYIADIANDTQKSVLRYKRELFPVV